MTNPHLSPVVRRVSRAVTLVPVLLVAGAFPASAAPPSEWPEPPSVSALDMLLVIALIPLGLAALISLLAVIPSMRRGDGAYQPGLAWRHEPEWFGGPRDGLEKADRSDPDASATAGERGGSGGRW